MQQPTSFRSYWTLALVLILGLGLALAVTTVIAAPPRANPAAAQATTFRVAKTGDGSDGLTWATAFTDVQDALTAATGPDEIWVATGVYTPGIHAGSSFNLANGVGMYGGFSGGETERDQRDWEANVTVLSGDIDGNDSTDDDGIVTDPFDIQGTNAGTVVNCTGLSISTTLDGFAITAGDGIGDGGGMYLDDSSPDLRNLLFSANRSTQDGGALQNTGTSSPTLTHVQFVNNRTSTGRGGAVANDNNAASLTLVDATFSGNQAQDGTHGGGGIFIHHGEVHVIDSTFTENSANRHGGAIYNLYGTLRVENSTFSGNYATGHGHAGAIYNEATLSVTGSTFVGNTATSHGLSDGGAIEHSFSSAAAQGAGIHSASTLADIANSTFHGNEAGDEGGAIKTSAPLTLTNCTLSHNSAGGNGDGLHNESTLHLINTIMANTETGVDCFNHGSNSIATDINNLIETTADPHMCGTPALTTDPKLSPPADNGGKTQTMALNSNSPAIDAGNDAACAANPVNNLDQRGVARPQGAHCDIGAYEAVQAIRCYVHNDDTSADYESYDAVAVQQAVDEASDGHLLKVAGYCQGVVLSGVSYQTVHITKSLTLQGGYTHTNWLSAPDLDTYRTTLDANLSGRVAFVSNTLGVTLNHLVMTKGKTADEGYDGHGGGIYSSGSLALDHCVVTSNSTGYESAEFGQGGIGAGICSLGALSVHYSTITANAAGHGSTGGHGGGIYISGTLTLDHSTVSNNQAGDGASGTFGGHGGGIYVRGTASVVHSTISGNSSGASEQSIGDAGDGGGIYNVGTLEINNSTLNANATGECSGDGDCNSGGRGGGLYSSTRVTISHSTVTSNTIGSGFSTTGDGGGIYNDGGSASLQNTILAGNADDGGETPDCGGTLTSLDYNLIEDTAGCTIDGAPANDITGQDPQLSPLGNHGGPAAPLDGEPTWTQALLPTSPALDHIPNGAGGCGTTYSDDQRDLPRPQPAAGSCDIGAVEMQPRLLIVSIAGDGSGTVTSQPPGIDCDTGTCQADFGSGTTVTLTAAADAGSFLDTWSGDCAESTSECVLTMDTPKQITATFVLETFEVYLPNVSKNRP